MCFRFLCGVISILPRPAVLVAVSSVYQYITDSHFSVDLSLLFSIFSYSLIVWISVTHSILVCSVSYCPWQCTSRSQCTSLCLDVAYCLPLTSVNSVGFTVYHCTSVFRNVCPSESWCISVYLELSLHRSIPQYISVSLCVSYFALAVSECISVSWYASLNCSMTQCISVSAIFSVCQCASLYQCYLVYLNTSQCI